MIIVLNRVEAVPAQGDALACFDAVRIVQSNIIGATSNAQPRWPFQCFRWDPRRDNVIPLAAVDLLRPPRQTAFAAGNCRKPKTNTATQKLKSVSNVYKTLRMLQFWLYFFFWQTSALEAGTSRRDGRC